VKFHDPVHQVEPDRPVRDREAASPALAEHLGREDLRGRGVQVRGWLVEHEDRLVGNE